MLRRCDSIVFSLRNSSAAISLFVMRSVTSSAISSSRFVSEAIRSRPAAGPRASRRTPSLRSSRRTASRSRSEPQASSSRSASRSSAIASCALASGGQRPAQQLPRECRLQPGPGRGRALDRRSAPARRRLGASPVCEQDRRPRPPAPAPRAGAGPRPAASSSARSRVRLGRLDVARRQLRQGEHLPVEAALDRDRELDLVAAERPHRLAAALGLAGGEERDRRAPSPARRRPRGSCRRSAGRRTRGSPRRPRSRRRGRRRSSAARPARTAPRRGSGGCPTAAPPRPPPRRPRAASASPPCISSG